MGYDYNDFKDFIFSDEGQRKLIQLRDHAVKMIEAAGAVRYDKLVRPLSCGTWEQLALVDRLVELATLRAIKEPSVDVVTQYTIYVAGDLFPGKS